MLTPVQCLNEIVSAVPNAERRFHVENELMGLDPAKAIAAQSFKGKILVSEEGQDYETEKECRFIEVFFEGGVHITTMLTDGIKDKLFGVGISEVDGCHAPNMEKDDGGLKTKPKSMPPYSEPRKLPEYKRTDTNSWN